MIECSSIPMYTGSERTTLDGEWTHDELEENVRDECIKILTPTYVSKFANKAMYDKNLLLPPYMAEEIINNNGDLIDAYNELADKHRSDNKFGIYLFDRWIEDQVKTILRYNLVGGIK